MPPTGSVIVLSAALFCVMKPLAGVQLPPGTRMYCVLAPAPRIALTAACRDSLKLLMSRSFDRSESQSQHGWEGRVQAGTGSHAAHSSVRT